jgi:type IV fimbrial biogenesis protein FimT
MESCVRRDPPATRQRGFTIIELLVTVTLVAIGASLAVPGAASMIANRRVQGAAQSILDGLQQGRSEAVRRNVPVRFTLSPTTGWVLANDSSATVIQSYATPDWSTLTVAGTPSEVLVFLPNGLIKNSGTPMTQVTVSTSVADTRTRQINIFGGGLIRMCDPGVTTAADPRKC